MNIYDLIDINDEIKKHKKLSKIIENKIDYPIKKIFLSLERNYKI